jgi:hypothetical protein
VSRKKYQTRLASDRAEQVDEYMAEHDISQSEAVRRLVEAGLEVERDDGEITDTREMSTATMDERVRLAGGLLMLLSLVFLVVSEVGLI